MLLWVLMAVMTAVVLGAMALPLLAEKRGGGHQRVDHDMAVYRAQLTEVDADLARGQIQPSEAEASRNEIARRILALSGAADKSAQNHSLRRPALAATLVMVPVAAIAIYLLTGAPTLPDQPLIARVEAPQPKDERLDVLIAQVEERLKANPNDGEGWQVIAPVYFKQSRFEDAANAYRQAVLLVGEDPKLLEGYGEFIAMAGNGVISDAAKRAFERAGSIDPGRVKPQFWLALALEQDGKSREALAAFKSMQAKLQGMQPWSKLVDARIAHLSEQVTAEPSAPALGGPTAADVENAATMSEADRKAMISGMVAKLAGDLQTNGKNLEGWLRLMRSYSVLGDTAKASTALADARKNFTGDTGALATIEALARELKL